MKTFGFLIGLGSIISSALLALSFFADLADHRHLDVHHDGILLMAVCGVTLGTILMVLCEKSVPE